MRPISNDPSRASKAACLALLLAAWTAAGVRAQVVGDPGTIEGRIRFTITNSTILDLLDQPGEEGLTASIVNADSIVNATYPTQFNNSTTDTAVNPTELTDMGYEITTQSGPDYWVRVDARLDGGGDQYLFERRQTTGGVPSGSFTTVDFDECIGLLQVDFVCPATVQGGRISALYDSNNNGIGDTLQARDFAVPPGSTQELLAVRGDETYRVLTRVDFGADPYSNQIRTQCDTAVQVACGEIVPISCPCDSGSQELGKIVGEIDMLGEDEHEVAGLTFVQADNGPFGNFRRDQVTDARTPSCSGACGDYELENLVASSATDPATGYRVFGQMSFRTGRDYEFFQLPILGSGLNPRVDVGAGMCVDLEDVFVMDPAFYAGDIELKGPPANALPEGSCLEALSRASDVDTNGDGIPNNYTVGGTSMIEVRGVNSLAIGSDGLPETWASISAQARADFDGAFVLATDSFEGDYEAVVAGLEQESAEWRRPWLWTRFVDVATPGLPETYQNSWVRIIDNNHPEPQLLHPGTTAVRDHRYCYGQVNLSYSLTTGALFYNPRISGGGAFQGTDDFGQAADYAVALSFGRGTPNNLGAADTAGAVKLCLPAGTYTDLVPFVTAVNPGGGLSNTELPPVTFTLDCGEIIDVTIGCDPVEPEVRTQGFWKRQCRGPHPSGEHDNLPDYVDPVNDLATFAAVGDVPGLCDRLDPDPQNDKCEQAEAQLMAAALNLASGRVAECNCLDDADLGATTLGAALDFVDGLLSNPGRTFQDCVLAQAIADRINNGETLVDCPE